MQGQIIRVSGTFNNSNLPKLTDFDTSFLLKEILNHEACVHFYDFTDVSKMTLNGSKVLTVIDLKGGNPFNATSEALAPSFNATAFNNRGGVVFNGAHEGVINKLFENTQLASLELGVQITVAESSNKFIASDKDQASNAIFYRNNALAGGNGSFAIPWNGKLYARNRFTCVYDYRVGAEIDSNLALNGAFGTKVLPHATANPNGNWNIGRWADSSAPNYGYFILGHLAVFTTDSVNDDYLNALLQEYCLRQYNV